ncbi:hypothetical protein M513_06045 [Trichuris suis]|uniref:Armadillo/beta-catenin-like repeat protein n=1 Tax=Trichuris suis TaxID=68888 RepID=A0A085M7D5_9BILA|nr:hypothetical protein M513_06045 [Trichuris suis]
MAYQNASSRPIQLAALLAFGGVLVAYVIWKQKKKIEGAMKARFLEEAYGKDSTPISEGLTKCGASTGAFQSASVNPAEVSSNALFASCLKTADEDELANNKADTRKRMIDLLNSLCEMVNKNADDQPFSINMEQGTAMVRLLKDEDRNVAVKSLVVIQAAACTEENRTILCKCGILDELTSLINQLPCSGPIGPTLLYCIGNLAANNDLHSRMVVHLRKLISLLKLKKETQLKLATLAALVNFTRIINDSEVGVYKELIPELLKCANAEDDLGQQSYAFAIMHNLSKVPKLASAIIRLLIVKYCWRIRFNTFCFLDARLPARLQRQSQIMPSENISPTLIRLAALVTFAGLSVAYLLWRQRKQVDNTKSETDKERSTGAASTDGLQSASVNPMEANVLQGSTAMLGSLSLKTADDEELATLDQLVDSSADTRKAQLDVLNSLCDMVKKNADGHPFSINMEQGRMLVEFLKDADRNVVIRSLIIIQAAACTEENRTVLCNCGVFNELTSMVDRLPDSGPIAHALLFCIGDMAANSELHVRMSAYLPKLISLMKLKEKEAQLMLATLAALVNFTRIVNDSEVRVYKELIPELLKCANSEEDIGQRSYAFAIMHNLSKVPELASALGEIHRQEEAASS